MSQAENSAGECPPHHWMVTEQAQQEQLWTCVRCGAVQGHSTKPASPNSDTGAKGREQARLNRQQKRNEKSQAGRSTPNPYGIIPLL
jgi:hypothetical protein